MNVWGPVSAFSMCMSSSLGIHITLHLPAEFRPNMTIHNTVMTSNPFFKMAARTSQFYIRFRLREFAHLVRSKSTCAPNFGEISPSTAKILLSPVSENKRPPCWNSTSGSDFYVFVTIGMPFCIMPIKFLISAAEFWRHIHFSKWRPSAILNFLKGNCRSPTKCKWWFQVDPQISTRSDL